VEFLPLGSHVNLVFYTLRSKFYIRKNHGQTIRFCNTKLCGSKHRVIARGHLGGKESCARGAKGTEFSYRGDHCDLQAPSDPTSSLFSLEVNEGKKEWLKPLFMH
jgi:hypothetical protein